MAKGKSRKVTVELLADESRLKRGLRNSAKEVDRFGGKLRSIGKTTAIAFGAIGAGALAAVGGLSKLGSSFDQARDTIRVGTGATGDALRALQDDFAQVAKDGPWSFEQVGTAIADLNTLTGLTGQPLQDLTEQFLDLNRITGGDLESSMQSINRVFGDWGIATEDQAGTMDELFRASQATGTSIDTLAKNVVQFGAPLRQMGFDFEDSVALFGKWQKEGVNAELVMGGLRQGISRIAKDGGDVPTVMGEIFESITDAGSASEATAIAIERFGARAGPDLAAAIREGRFEIGDLVDVIENGADTIGQAADDTESFGEKWATLKNRIFVGLQPLAEKIFDGLGDLMDRLGPKIEVVAGWLEDHIPPALEKISDLWDRWAPKVRDFARRTVGDLVDKLKQMRDWFGRNRDVVEGLKVGLGVLAGAAVIGAVIAGIQALTGAIIAMGVAITANPIGVAVVALAALATGLTVAYRRSEKFREIVDRMRDGFETFVDFVVEWAPKIWETMQQIWDEIAPIVEGIIRQIRGVAEFLAGVFTLDWDRAWAGIREIVGGAKDALLGTLGVLRDGMVRLGGLAMDGLKSLVSDGWDALLDLVNAGIDSLIDLIGDLPGLIGDAAKGAFDGLRWAFEEVVRGIAIAWNKLDFKIDIKVPSFIPGIGGKGWRSPDLIPDVPVPSFAAGGLVSRPTVALVGDAGPGDPEIVSPVSMMRDVLRTELSGLRQGPQIIEVRIGDRTIERVVVDALARRDRLAGTRVVT